MLFRAALIALAISAGLNAVSCTRLDRLKAENKAQATELRTTRAQRDASAKALVQSEAYRKQEAQNYADALTASRLACQSDMAAVRKAEAAKRALHLKPVPMKDGCPVRQLVQASEMGLK